MGKERYRIEITEFYENIGGHLIKDETNVIGHNFFTEAEAIETAKDIEAKDEYGVVFTEVKKYDSEWDLYSITDNKPLKRFDFDVYLRPDKLTNPYRGEIGDLGTSVYRGIGTLTNTLENELIRIKLDCYEQDSLDNFNQIATLKTFYTEYPDDFWYSAIFNVLTQEETDKILNKIKEAQFDKDGYLIVPFDEGVHKYKRDENKQINIYTEYDKNKDDDYER